MPLTIGSNIASLRAQRAVEHSSRRLSSVFERLSSGQRINRASDDAAGLAIADTLSARGRIAAQGLKNINDGVSLLNIADGALEQLSDVVIRIKELAEQSANGVFSNQQRRALNSEAKALEKEFNRIVESTEFNGIVLLNGDESTRFQDGIGTDGSVEVRYGLGIEDIRRASASSTDTQGNGASTGPSLSADGRFVAFSSSASNLVAGDTNNMADIFVKDNLTGGITRVSVDSTGNQANSASNAPSISADGRFVVFESLATNLVSDDSGAATDIFLHDLQTRSTTRLSVGVGGVEADATSNQPSITADGRFVTFYSLATNLVANDTNNNYDAFVYDRDTGVLERLSVSSAGAQGNSSSFIISEGISADGRYVTFNSNATNMVSGDTNGVSDVFLRDRLTGTTTRISLSGAGAQGNNHSYDAKISADGRFIVYRSDATNLAANDLNAATDLFLYDHYTGSTSRISVSSSGAEANGTTFAQSISADGRFIAFHSLATNLVSGDTNGQGDIFLRDTGTGTTTRINVSSLGAQANGSTISPSISADGRFVSFRSDATGLISGDTNGLPDIFVAPNEAAAGHLSNVDLSTASLARYTLDSMELQLHRLSESRSSIGASQSRFEVAAAKLRTDRENFSAAESRIRDSDIAEESSALVRLGILQQAGAAVLAQANQQPALTLQLLR